MLVSSGFPQRPQIHHFPGIDLAERRRLHGSGCIMRSAAVQAGDNIDLTLRFELGETAIPAGGHLRVAWLWPFDWAMLQTSDPSAPGYVHAFCSRRGVALRVTFAFRGDLIPWNHHIDVEVLSGVLTQGDAVELTCREWRAPTFIVPDAELLFLINLDGGDRWVQLPPVRGFPIVAGTPARLFALAPADGLIDEDLALTLRVEDVWGNPLLIEGLVPEVVPADGVRVVSVERAGDMPAYRARVRIDSPGIHRIEVAVPRFQLRVESNPVRIAAESPPLRIFWGDLHAGQGQIGCGVGSVRHHFDYARHVAGLQVCSHQANDHHVSLDLWEQTRRESVAANEEGSFIAFLGCEWSAYTPEGGDRNVMYRRDEPRLRRSGRFFTEDVSDPEPDLATATEFLAVMRDEEVFINMHAGGRPTNLDFHEPRIETLAEVHSTHGTSDWFVLDALRRGYRVGITAGTDGVAGRPGCDHPGSRLIRNARSGVTAFLASELTQDGLWEAIAARRCYATDGPRILLDVRADGYLMGSEYATTESPLVSIEAEGTAAIEQIDLLCGPDLLWTWRPTMASAEGALRILWGGTERRGSAPDQRVFWQGRFAVEKGRIASVEPVALVTPYDRLERVDDQTVCFDTVSAGNRMGMCLEIEADAETLCRFESGPATFEFGLAQVRKQPMKVDAGGTSRHVIVGPVPNPNLPRRVELSFRDTRIVQVLCPYWVQLTQCDQHRAWSSPIYVQRQFG